MPKTSNKEKILLDLVNKNGIDNTMLNNLSGHWQALVILPSATDTFDHGILTI